MKKRITYFNKFAAQRDSFIRKNKYYYSLLYSQYRTFIPPGKKVLEVGCATGELLNAVSPSFGVGVDLSPRMVKIAASKFKNLKFFEGEISSLPADEKFDYVICSGLLGEMDD